MAKPTYNDKRRYKYAIILNATGNVKLATKDRQLSDANFTAKYGFDVRKTERQPKGARKSTQYIYNKYLRLRDLGYKPEVAKKLKYQPIKELGGKLGIGFVSTAFNQPAPKTKASRKDRWKKWAEKDAIPEYIKKLAYQINDTTKLPNGRKLDIDDKYGFAICYYAYIENKPINEIIDQMQLDRNDGDIYQYQKKIG